MMNGRFGRCGLQIGIALFVWIFALGVNTAVAAIVSGAVTISPVATGGQVYISIFDAEAPDLHNLIARGAFSAATTTAYTIDLGSTPPDKIILIGFYDRNNSSDPEDGVMDWPDFGDAVGYAAQSPIAVGTSDIPNIDFSIATTYAGTGSTTLYDDFSQASGWFEPANWFHPYSGLERVRRVESQALVSAVRSAAIEERNGLNMRDSGPIERLRSRVLIDSFALANPNDGDTYAYARIDAVFYNSETATPASPQGDVWACMGLGSGDGSLIAFYDIMRCTDDIGENWEKIGGGELSLPGIALANWYQLEIETDQQSGGLTFSVYDSAGDPLWSQTRSDIPTFMGHAYLANSGKLETATASNRPETTLCHIFAKFDDVYLNGALYDDFSGGALDPARWATPQTARAIENGEAVMMAESTGTRETVSLPLAHPLPTVHVDVIVDPQSQVQGGSRGRVRLSGDVYNADYGQAPDRSYNGRAGVVWAQVYLDLYADGTMAAKYYMEKSLVADPVDWNTDYEVLFSGTFDVFTGTHAIQKGRKYRLGIEFSGSQLIFSCTDIDASLNQQVAYAIDGPAYPLEYNSMAIASRVYDSAETDAGGRMIARFDRVALGDWADADGDRISDFDELCLLFNPMDGDMDGDGLMDGSEDYNRNGRMDYRETDPRAPDTDGDGVNDGTESGLTSAQLPVFADASFVVDEDPTTTTNPLDPDTDGDGHVDGAEDANANGRVDAGESDPNKGCSVSGRVVNAAGTPVAGLWVHAFDQPCGGNWLGGATTDDNGYYAMTRMPAGDVFVEACARCNDLMLSNEWWTGSGNPGAIDCNDALNLGLQVDEDREDIDFQLEPAGALSGTIVDTNGDPIADVHVFARSAPCDGTHFSGSDTDAEGNFTVYGLPEGSVYFYACPTCNGLNFVDEWYDGETGSGTRDCGEAAAVSITSGTTATLSPMALDVGHTLSGTVVGEETDGIFISIHDWTSGAFLGGGGLNPDGSFTIVGLPAPESGYYRIYLNSGTSYYLTEDFPDPVSPDAPVAVVFNPVRGGRIIGHVAGEGQPLASVDILVNASNCGDWVNGTATDAAGNYAVVLPAGDYTVQARSDSNPDINFVFEYWTATGGALQCEAADIVTLTSGEDTPVDFDLSPGGSISGSVRDAEGQPLGGVHVYVRTETCGGGLQYSQADTDADGQYRIKGIPEGNVYVYACPDCNGMNYLGEWYDHIDRTGDCNAGTAVHVSVGTDTGGIDFELAPGHTIEGTVTDASGNPVADHFVEILDSEEWDIFIGGARTDENGHYAIIGMPAPPSGSYRVYLQSSSIESGLFYVGEFYPTPVAPDQTGIDFSPQRGARISGTVSGDSGPLAGVCIHMANAPCEAFSSQSGYTGEDGAYTFLVPEGTIYLYANPECNASLPFSGQYWTAAGGVYDCAGAASIAVETGTETRIDFELPRLEEIFGTVSESQTGIHRADATIELLPVGDDGRGYIATTDSSGGYSVFVRPGDYYLLASAPGLAREFYDDVYPSSEASRVTITAGDLPRQIDFVLDVGGSISGTIYATDGLTPINGAQIRIRPSKHFFDRGFDAQTDVNGYYRIDSLPLGLYKVTATADGYAQLKYYAGAYGWENAENVLVQPPAETTGIDIQLDPEAMISGTITATDTGSPLQLSVIADPANGQFEGIGAEADIGEGGQYTIRGLPPASYTLRVDSDIDYYVGEFFNNAYTRSSAVSVAVNAGAHQTGIDFKLERGGKITGRVVDDETGQPIREIQLACQTENGDGLPSAPGVDDNGYFSLNVMPGAYTLNVFHTPGYISEFYQDAYTFDTATLIDVEFLTTTAGIEIRLNRGGSIQGHLYTDDGITPLAGASLYAFPVNPDLPGSGSISEADGSYAIEGLPTGTYVVKAVTTGHAMQSRAAAVIMPDATADIDIQLTPYPYSVATVREHIVPPSGGTISVGSEDSGFNFVGLEFSAGALDDYTLISISQLDDTIAPMPPALSGINIPVHLGPEGSTFDAPVFLKVAYTDQDLADAGLSDAGELDVFTLNTDTFLWEPVDGLKIVDYDHRRIEIQLEHFSIYQLGHSTAVQGDFGMDNDVDGSDLADYIRRLSEGSPHVAVESFAGNFGQQF